MNDYRERLARALPRVREAIAEACRRAGRRPEEVTIVAVTKGHPVEALRAARQAGLTDIGENRVAEALAKACPEPGRGAPDAGDGLTWHLIGHLQTNKVRKALPLFETIHSLDRMALAEEIQKEAARAELGGPVGPRHGAGPPHGAEGGGRRIRCFLQVNASGEATKGGFRPDEVVEAARRIAAMDRIEIVGLMTMAPIADDPERTRPVFRALRELRDRVRVEVPGAVGLSMGMSQDYTVAVGEGATHVRLGTALFGERL